MRLEMVLSRCILGGLLALAFSLSTSAFADETAKEKIAELEAKLAAKKGEFDWSLHNELRHYYGAVNREREFHHMNVILANSLMDGYMLNILSGWELDKNQAAAIGNLRQTAAAKKQFPLVAAACWLKIAELEGKGANADAVRASLHQVLELKGEDIEPYHALAKRRLEDSGNDDESISRRSKY